MHSFSFDFLNPYAIFRSIFRFQIDYFSYQLVISTVARTLSYFDDDKLIPTYGFGDKVTKEKAVFPFFPDERPCNGVEESLSRYLQS